jgi:glycosyltransferase involved in cell wall biosynthesis
MTDTSLIMSQTIIHVPRRFVSHEWGGTETVITEISRQQQRAGFSPKIVSSMALAHDRSEIISGIPVERHGYCYPFLGLGAAEKAALDKKGGNLLSLSLFTALLREPNVRLFHAHSLKRLGGSVATAARLKRKPFVVSLHGGVFDVPASELGAMTKPIEGRFEWGRVFGALFRSRRILDDADMVICVGQSELEAAKKNLSHDRIAYLPNGVDTNRFSGGNGANFRAQHGIASDAFVVLNISRIDSQKNQHVLVEAFTRLIKTNPSARLVLIGPETQPDYAKRVRATIHAHGLQHAAQILPGLRNDDPALLDAYQACDTFVLPSMHEPFGIVVLEAWSAGKPVIASRIGGLKHLIRDEHNGLFFDVECESEVEHLTDQLKRLSENKALREYLATNGQHEARRNYDWQRIHTQQEGIYQQAEAHFARRSSSALQSRDERPPTPFEAHRQHHIYSRSISALESRATL